MFNLQNFMAGVMAFIATLTGIFNSAKTITFEQAAQDLNPLSIVAMRARSYPGSDIQIEQTLSSNSFSDRYIVSYKSDGLKIFGLLLVPKAEKPANGFPVIIFNHGYITPEFYSPLEKYSQHENAFVKNGYIVFKPDYRGNWKSEGEPASTYFSPDYTVDDLNAIASIKKYKDVNPNKLGVWGHSMGGSITLRDTVVNTKDIKAAVIWAGVVGSYDQIVDNWQNRVKYKPDKEDLMLRTKNRDILVSIYGNYKDNPEFWKSIDPSAFVKDINTPIQIHVGESDNQVPPDFSSSLYDKLKKANKTVEFYSYPGADHNLSQGFNLAMKRSIEFFNRYLRE
ncbi:MAG TPA: alpha/beta fold hydrolase [Patescibacteria group bacterium]|nr:alpha/beta fold hydrolase [Patescibacteria group bacterium]